MVSELCTTPPLKWRAALTVKMGRSPLCAKRSRSPRQRRPTTYNLFVRHHFQDTEISHESPQQRFKLIAFMWKELREHSHDYLDDDNHYEEFEFIPYHKPRKFGILKFICPCFR
ncbi:unnamed protein product [Phytomonas sp. Hart1]|nr:unnamed protein product [Phytomonas sp. Hart1]|eukprot:CCW70002.1 unnamed protein product [Phytomonas sp. isolate Hart1]